MTTINFKNTEYTVTANHNVPALLANDGLKAQMTVKGNKGAEFFLQIWQHELGEVYKMIGKSGRLEVELK